ncbi:vanadium-dependent haloperoxidase [Roseivirga sp. E12]|uniref:vanadium-dependent haloperoxidase n=1 Tax=Roseivirga sp. E12 TaxID=2819237 RepID=UPI001ABD0B19|nr:vanadium-dependent haloperoxidase [Roseivirga sp. E12]MBO3698230.1 vanadium-dependent haloperoxidase [Roseivirga sp. E12]
MKKVKNKLIYLAMVLTIAVQSCDNQDGLDIETTVGETNEDLSLEGNGLAQAWTDLFLELERYSAGRPNASARATAYIYLAAYETVVPGMTNSTSNEDRLRGLSIRQSEKADEISYRIALNTCFAQVIDHFLINVTDDRTSAINALETDFESTLSTGLSEELVEDSKAWGQYIAERVITYSQTDDDAEEQILEPQPTSYEPPTGEGFWTYSADPERALFPYWESVRTFVVKPKETTAVDPIAYSEDPESEYYQQMVEVYNANNAAREENGEQLWIAEFWSDDVEGLMMSPPVRQVSIANQLIEQYNLSLEESLVLFLKLGFALNDAAVAAWKYKYEFMVMRPNVFIHEFIDPDYQTNLFRLVFWPNPSFPSYPSGHSTFASAAGGLFIDTFGNETNFTDRTHEGRTEFVSTPRTFSTFEQMAYENAFSRLPLGVHMSMDCEEGLRLGYEISDAVKNLDLSSTNQ